MDDVNVLINKLLNKEKTQLGVKESPMNSNNVKYNTWFYGKSVSGTDFAWCMSFQNWCFNQCGLDKYFFGGERTASCTTLRDWYLKNKKYQIVTSNYKAGDILLFNFKDKALNYKTSTCYHVGLCTKSTNTTVTSIDGNTSSTSEDNGGIVQEKTRSIKYVVCGIRWYLESEENSTSSSTTNNQKEETVKVELKSLKKEDENETVKALQVLLNGYGFSCGMVDSVFGSKTDYAVKSYQRKYNLTVDGEVGVETWNSLLGNKGE